MVSDDEEPDSNLWKICIQVSYGVIPAIVAGYSVRSDRLNPKLLTH